jgi:hypothetical protein
MNPATVREPSEPPIPVSFGVTLDDIASEAGKLGPLGAVPQLTAAAASSHNGTQPSAFHNAVAAAGMLTGGHSQGAVKFEGPSPAQQDAGAWVQSGGQSQIPAYGYWNQYQPVTDTRFAPNGQKNALREGQSPPGPQAARQDGMAFASFPTFPYSPAAPTEPVAGYRSLGATQSIGSWSGETGSTVPGTSMLSSLSSERAADPNKSWGTNGGLLDSNFFGRLPAASTLLPGPNGMPFSGSLTPANKPLRHFGGTMGDYNPYGGPMNGQTLGNGIGYPAGAPFALQQPFGASYLPQQFGNTSYGSVTNPQDMQQQYAFQQMQQDMFQNRMGSPAPVGSEPGDAFANGVTSPGARRRTAPKKQPRTGAQNEDGGDGDEDELGPEGLASMGPDGKKMFTCMNPGCGKTYGSRGHLNRHRRVHKTTTWYTCPIDGCDKTFARIDNMKVRKKRGERKQCGERSLISFTFPDASRRTPQEDRRERTL